MATPDFDPRDYDGGRALPLAVKALNTQVVVNEIAAIGSTLTTVVFADTPYTALATDTRLYCDTSGGAITVLLPASAAGLRKIEVFRDGVNTVTVDGSGAETVADNQGGGATYVLATDGDVATLLDTNKSAKEWWLV